MTLALGDNRDEQAAAVAKIQAIQRGRSTRAKKQEAVQASSEPAASIDLEQLRLQARKRVSQANAEGTLDEAVKVAQKLRESELEDLRRRCKKTLGAVSEAQAVKVAQNLRVTQLEDLRQRSKQALEAVSQASPAIELDKDEVERCKTNAREAILKASQDGLLDPQAKKQAGIGSCISGKP